MYCSYMYKSCLIVVLNNAMQVYFVLQNELLQAGILELDTLFSLVTTLDFNFCDLSISVKISKYRYRYHGKWSTMLSLSK